MQELILDPSDDRWLTLISRSSQANISHHPSWINLLADCYGYNPFIIAICDLNGKITAGLPMMEINSRLTGRRWVSLPFTDYCQPLFQNAESLDKLTEYVIQLFSNKSILKIELRWEFPDRSTIRPLCSSCSPYNQNWF
jgi:CelD/BcsL family acetyltransferase involved in cellulose biosynthesis